jgi:hypothetical protein
MRAWQSLTAEGLDGVERDGNKIFLICVRKVRYVSSKIRNHIVREQKHSQSKGAGNVHKIKTIGRIDVNHIALRFIGLRRGAIRASKRHAHFEPG